MILFAGIDCLEDVRFSGRIRSKEPDGLQYFRSINHKIYILTQVPEIIPPNLLHP